MEIIMLLDNPLAVDARVEKEAQVLSAHGHSVKIFALEDGKLPASETRLFGRVFRVLDPVMGRPFSKKYNIFKNKLLNDLATENFDILHCHDYQTFLLGAGLKKINKNFKLIYDSHEYLSGWPFYKEIQGIVNRIKGKIVWRWFVNEEKKAIPLADKIITVSDSIAEEMKTQFRLTEKPVVIRNVPETAPLLTEKYFHKKFCLSDTAKVMVHSGNPYHSLQRIKMLAKVIGEFPHLYLIFIGNTDKLNVLKREIPHPRILFHDYMDRMALNTCLSAADFGIVHTWQPGWKSHWMSLPNRIMEYTAAGLPVITTRQPEFLKLGEQYGHMTFYHGTDQDELRQAIGDALERQAELRQKALVARKELSWAKEAEKLISLYKDLA